MLRRIFLLIFLLPAFVLQAQDDVQIIKHTVKPKETLMSIARKYKVTPYKIIKYNPGISENIHPGDVINIPLGKTALDTLQSKKHYVGFKYHTVGENETLFSISRQYNTTVDDIVAVNRIESNNIKLGQIIIIPILPDPHQRIDTTRYTFYTVQPKEGKWRVAYKHGITVEDLERLNPEIQGKPLQVNQELVVPKNRAEIHSRDDKKFIYHEVQPLETVFGLSKQYGITEEELIRANPELTEGLKAGQIIRIPRKTQTGENPADDGRFFYHKVAPKETVYGLTKRYNITTSDLLKYNPQLADGLKAGMILRIPKPDFEVVFDINAPLFIRIVKRLKPKEFVTNLVENARKDTVYRMAVLLPFRLDQFKRSDSTGKACISLLRDKVTDYYAGIRAAKDSLEAMGFRIQMDVFDTRADAKQTEKILLNNDLSDYDFVLGPVFPDNISKTGEALMYFNTPVVVPGYKGTGYPNLVQSVSDSASLANHMLAYINEVNIDGQILVIYDEHSATTADTVMSRLGTLNKLEVRKSKHGNWVRIEDLQAKLSKAKFNRIVLVTKDQSLIANLFSALDGLSAEFRLETFMLDEMRTLDKFDLKQMAAIRLHFPSRKRLQADPRVRQYIRRKYGLLPTATVLNGFDTTMDLVLRRANAVNLFDGLKRFGKTEQSDRIFLYGFNPQNGFRNTASYIILIDSHLTPQQVD